MSGLDLARRLSRRLPLPLRRPLNGAYGRLKIRRARRAFERAKGRGGVLDIALLPTLVERYEPPPVVRYDEAGLAERAGEKIEQLSRAVDVASVRTAVELGCWDGMVGAALAAGGATVVGLDICTDGFDVRARSRGVRFLRCNAESIAAQDRSLDLIYSFAAFEHFLHPDRVVAEAARVVRPGGHLYLHFGPLYFSPYGRHAYRQIPVPFCHLLFAESDLHRWAEAHGLPHDWPLVNGWSLRRYRALWRECADAFAITQYREHTTGGIGMELIASYPGCFRGRADDFDEFLVAAIEICLRRR